MPHSPDFEEEVTHADQDMDLKDEMELQIALVFTTPVFAFAIWPLLLPETPVPSTEAPLEAKNNKKQKSRPQEQQLDKKTKSLKQKATFEQQTKTSRTRKATS